MHGSSTVDVHLIPTPRDDEIDHMPVTLFEYGVRHYQFELTAQSQ